MALCISNIKKSGNQCGKKAQPGKLYCGTHDPERIQLRKANKKVAQDLSEKVLIYIAESLGIQFNPEDELEDQESKRSTTFCNPTVTTKFVQSKLIANIAKIALMDRDFRGLPTDACPFPRKVWMIISWHLSDDLATYSNVAMTSKSLYKVFVQDKVRHMKHPLLTNVLSPKVFFMPVFRILWFEPPKNLDNLLKFENLPTTSEVTKFYDEDQGPAKNELDANQRKAHIIISLVKQLINKNLKPKEKLQEAIPGANIYTDPPKGTNPKFQGLGLKYTVVREGPAAYLVLNTHFDETRGLENDLMDTLVSHTPKGIFSIMKVRF